MVTVAIIGADGAGKTTITRQLVKTLPLPVKYVYMGVNLETSNLVLPTTRLWLEIKRWRGKRPDIGPSDPTKNEAPKRGLQQVAASLKSNFRTANLLAEEWYRQSIVWFYQRRGYIVVFDRHFFFDYYFHHIQPSRQRLYLSERLHGFILNHFYPRPDLVICLDAPGEVLFARKGEASVAVLENRRIEYLSFQNLVPAFVQVDARQPFDRVLEEVCGLIQNFYVEEKKAERATFERLRQPSGFTKPKKWKGLQKRMVFTLGQNRAFSYLIDLMEKTDSKQADLLRVLTYHRVDNGNPRPDLYPGLAVRLEDFEQQVRYLADCCHPVSIQQVITAFEGQASLPARAVLITFDDAYCDFAENAWPVLRRYELPAAIFVPTSYPDSPNESFWWDRLYAAFKNTERRDELPTPLGRFSLATQQQREHAFTYLHEKIRAHPSLEAMSWVDQIEAELGGQRPQPAVMGWGTLRRLAQEGLTLGAHTRTHPLLTWLTLEEAQAEIAGSIRDMERETGTAPPIFAYPGGKITDEAVQVLKAQGVALGFTTQRGINQLGTSDPFRLRRMNVGGKTPLAVIRAQLLAWPMAFWGANRDSTNRQTGFFTKVGI